MGKTIVQKRRKYETLAVSLIEVTYLSSGKGCNLQTRCSRLVN